MAARSSTRTRALGDLTENQEHLSGLELQGNARIETPDARPGELKLMAGDVINLTYYENTEVLQSAIVTGDTSLRIAGEQGAPERVLHAQNVEIGMAPDGTTLTSLTARDQVVLDLPATTDTAIEERALEFAGRQWRRRQGIDGGDIHRRC